MSRPDPSEIFLARNSSSQEFNIVRRIYQQDSLNADADYHSREQNLRKRCRKFVRRCGFGDCLKNAVPIIKWLPKYSFKENFVGDLTAGITIACLHVPHGIAYSLLAYCSPIEGLYMAFFPIFIYVMLGSSPHICLGTFAVAMFMAGKVVLEHATVTGRSMGDESVGSYTPEEVLSALTFTVGAIQVLMWCLRLGALSSLLSEPLVSGLKTATSFHVCASQLKDLFGIKLPKLPGNFTIIYIVIELCKRIKETNTVALLLAFITGILFYINNEYLKPRLSKYCRMPIPTELILIIAGTVVSQYMVLENNYDVDVVKYIRSGLPMPVLPPFELIDILLIDAIMVTIVTYTITMSMGLLFAYKEKYEIDGNQELLALGASNIFGCFFHCGPVCASLSRSYIQYMTGGKTLVTSFISAVLVLFVILWLCVFFESLPRSVLAAIIVVSIKGLYMHVTDFGKFWNLSKLDATVWFVTFTVTILVSVDIGLIAGLLANVGTLFYISQTPYSCLLGRVLETNLYLDIKRYRAAHEIPGVKIFHYCGGLNFASKNLFRNKLFRKTGYLRLIDEQVTVEESNLTRATSYVWDKNFSQKIHCIIVDASALSYVDAPGIKILVEVNQALTSNDITMLFAGANVPVLEMIERFNSLEKDQLQLRVFPTVHDAVTYYLISESQKRQSALKALHL